MRFQLALFVARSRIVRIAAILLFTVSALAIGINGFVKMMQVPSWAYAATEVGAADYAMALPVSGALPLDVAHDRAVTDAVVKAARDVGAVAPRIGYANGVVQIDGHGDVAMMMQQAWATDPFPRGYVLQSGRLPSRPDEAVVSPSLVGESPIGSSVRLFHGALTLKVVGVVENQVSRFANLVAVDSGTLQALSARNTKALSRYAVEFVPTLYWSGARPDDVAAAVTTVLGDDARANKLEVISAAQMRADTPPRLAELDLIVALAPVVATVVAAWMISRFLRRLRRTLVQLGVTRTTFSFSLTIAAALAAATVLGGLVGRGLLLLLRPLIARVSPSVLGAPEHLVGLIALVAGVTAATALCMLLSAMATGSRVGARGHVSPWWPWGIAAALFVGGLAIANGADINTKIIAVILLSSALCVVGSQALRLMPNGVGASPWVLAVRRVRGEGRGATVTVVALSVLLSTAFALITLYASDAATSNERIVERMPAGQAYFEPPQPDGALLGQIEKYLGTDDATPFAFIDAGPVDVDGLAMAVPSAHDVEKLVTRPLTTSERAALESGGALMITGTPDDTLRLTADDGRTIAWPGTVAGDLPPSFQRLSGIVLQSTAKKADLPLVRYTWAFTDLTASQRDRVDSAPQQLGFDAQWLEGYSVPEAYSVSGEVLLMLGALILVGACVIIAYCAGTARALRPRVGGLMAMGLARGWLSRALAGEIGLVVALAVGSAALAAALGVAMSIAIGAVPLHLSIPWALVSLVVLSFFAVACGATVLSMRRLRPAERNEW